MARSRRSSPRLSHLGRRGNARMVDVSSKKVTLRRAAASAVVHMRPQTLRLIHDGRIVKGDVFAVARLAGIQAAKRTADLVPLCHPLPVDAVSVDIEPRPPDKVQIVARAAIRARTGVEMEALVAAAVAALTIYDMCKAADRGMEIGPIRLDTKSGGRSGSWRRGRGLAGTRS